VPGGGSTRHGADALDARDKVITAIKKRYTWNMARPYPTRQILVPRPNRGDRRRSRSPAWDGQPEEARHAASVVAQEVAEMRGKETAEAEGKGEGTSTANDGQIAKRSLGLSLQLLVYTNADGARSDRPGVHDTNA